MGNSRLASLLKLKLQQYGWGGEDAEGLHDLAEHKADEDADHGADGGAKDRVEHDKDAKDVDGSRGDDEERVGEALVGADHVGDRSEDVVDTVANVEPSQVFSSRLTSAHKRKGAGSKPCLRLEPPVQRNSHHSQVQHATHNISESHYATTTTRQQDR